MLLQTLVRVDLQLLRLKSHMLLWVLPQQGYSQDRQRMRGLKSLLGLQYTMLHFYTYNVQCYTL